MATTTKRYQEWLSNSTGFRILAKAWNESDQDALLAKLTADSHLRAIEKELAKGLSKVYEEKHAPPGIEPEVKRSRVLRSGAPPGPTLLPPTLRGFTLEQLLADPECYRELLGPQKHLTSRTTSHVGRATLRMILSLEYPIFECREVELDTVIAAKRYLALWVRWQNENNFKWAFNLGLQHVNDSEAMQNLYTWFRVERLQEFNNLTEEAAQDFAAAKGPVPNCSQKPTQTSSSDRKEATEKAHSKPNGFETSIVPNTSKYRKSEYLRAEVESLRQNVTELETKHQKVGEMVQNAKRAVVAEEEEIHKLEVELKKARTRYKEAKQVPEKREAEQSQAGRELK